MGILVCALLPSVVPILSLLGTPGYISKRIKCDRAFYWKILKVYFHAGILFSRYSDYFKRGIKLSFQNSFIFEVLLKEWAPLCSLLCSCITQCDTHQAA